MNKDGLSARSLKQQKMLPRASGPSESRLESQRMITRKLLQKQTKAKGYDVTAKIIGTCIKKESKPTDEMKSKIETKLNVSDIKTEKNGIRQQQKPIKIEASKVHMVHRMNPADANNTWSYTHPSGSPCGRRHRLRGHLRPNKLPDRVPSNDPEHSAAQTPSGLPAQDPGLDTLSTPTATDETTTALVSTALKPNSTNTMIGTTATESSTHPSSTTTPITTCTIDQGTAIELNLVEPPPTMDSVPVTVSTPKSRNCAIAMNSTELTPTANSRPLAVSTPKSTKDVTEPPNITQVQEPSIGMQLEADLQTAKTLLELHKTLEIPESNQTLEDDNTDIMPVDAPPVPDYSKEYPLQTESQPNEEDTDDTLPYAEGDDAVVDATTTSPTCSPDQSPTGRFRFRHHGISRNLSSKKTKLKTYSWMYCPVTADSKRELNQHHQVLHGIMTCVDCNKQFPTPDALQRHQYIHQQNREQFTCNVCGEISAFESDMKRHKAKHDDERTWYCSNPKCD